jgi:hypothetical protein
VVPSCGARQLGRGNVVGASTATVAHVLPDSSLDRLVAAERQLAETELDLADLEVADAEAT